MKKIIATLLLITMSAFSLFACQSPDNSGQGSTDKINIGYMTGPTAMGMAKLINDNGGKGGNDKYAFTAYDKTETAKTDLTKGVVDIICLPTNEAAAYAKTVDSSIRVLAINCLNSLFLVSDKNNNVTSLSELEGKTVYTCKNGTPKIILDYIVNSLGLDITVSYVAPDGKEMAAPKDVQQYLVAGALPYAVIPEPLITAANLAIKAAGKAGEISYSVDIDLGDAYESIDGNTKIAMGCIVTTQTFIDKNKNALDAFLAEYKLSVEYIGNAENIETAAKYVTDAGIMAALPAAKSALTNLNGAIAYIDGAEMKTTLKAFYQELSLPTPDDAFYYEK